MLPALPEVLYYDDEKDTQVYDEPEKPIFKINIIKKFFNTKLSRYSDAYYTKLYKLFFETFPEEIKQINKFIFFKPPVPKEEEPVYIIDDLDDEGLITALLEDEEDEDESSIEKGGFLAGLWKIWRWIKRLRRAWRGFKRLLKMLRSGFSKLMRLAKAGWKRLLRYSKRMWIRFLKWYRRSFKPFMNRMIRRFKRFAKRLIRKLRVIVKRVAKKAYRYLRIIVKRFGKKILKKLVKMMSKKAIKLAITSTIKAIAGAFTATGIGSVIGVALFAAVTAWEVYDLTNDVSELTEAPDFEEEEGKQKEQPPAKEEEIKTPSFANLKITDVTKEHIETYNNNIKDEVTKTLINARTYPEQIIGRLYEFYKITDSWLLKQQQFVNNLFDTVVGKTNETLTKLVEFTDSKYDIDFTKKRPDVIKDPSKVRTPSHKSWDSIMAVQKRIENNETTNAFVRAWYGVKINTHDGVVYTKEEDDKKREWMLVKRVLSGERPADISTLDPRLLMVNPDQRMSREHQLRKEKIGALGVKNHLLYQLYTRLANIQESAPVSA